MKRHALWLVVSGILVLGMPLLLLFLWRFTSTRENSILRASWKEGGAGWSHVTGELTDNRGKGIPFKGLSIETVDGWSDGDTDATGHFAIEVGNPEITGVRVRGVGELKLAIWHPSAKAGLYLQVQLR